MQISVLEASRYDEQDEEEATAGIKRVRIIAIYRLEGG